jgi:hypothetical protein
MTARLLGVIIRSAYTPWIDFRDREALVRLLEQWDRPRAIETSVQNLRGACKSARPIYLLCAARDHATVLHRG